jgi:cytochrome b pre-mRNA-processing protein 3
VAAGNIDAVVERNIFRGDAPADAVSHVSAHLNAFANALADTPTAAILAGELP